MVKLDGAKALINNRTYDIVVTAGKAKGKNFEDIKGAEIKAPLPGSIMKVTVKTGDTVRQNDTVAVIEAMKMETEIKSPSEGTVVSVNISAGTQVNAGQILMTIK